MPAPATTDQLVTNLRKCGIIPPEKLAAALTDTVTGEAPSALLSRLVDDGCITRYQADKLAAGKYKGFVLGPYVILDRLGGGGMGHVFLAEHSAMKRHVAIKVLSAGSMNDDVARERFFREARVAAGLDHPHVVRVFDLRREDAVCYLVMEYVEGLSLHHVVSRHGPLPWFQAAEYARQIAVGLQYAHENGLVHRDIKPSNLLLSREGQVKIIDLGLVRWDVEVDSKLTSKVDNSILGTADYLAPEQAVNSSTVDIRADIYSLGATMFYILAGRTMFPEGKTAQKLMWQQLKAPPAIRDLVPDVPEGFAEVLHRCLAKLPKDRFATPQAVADALAPWCTEAPPLPDAEWFPAKRRGARTQRPASITDSRPMMRKPGLESTMLPPIGKSSHLFDITKSHPVPSRSEANRATVSDLADETPLRWPQNPTLTSHVYQPLLSSEPAPIRRTNSPLLIAVFVGVLALLGVGIALLAKLL